LIGPSLKKKNETTKAHQNRRFYFEVRVPPLWPTHIGEREDESEVLWRKCWGIINWELGEHIVNLKREHTKCKHIGNHSGENEMLKIFSACTLGPSHWLHEILSYQKSWSPF
jgi:hypothetical protein